MTPEPRSESRIASEFSSQVTDRRRRREIAHDLSNWLCCIEMLTNTLPKESLREPGSEFVISQLRHAAAEATDLCREFLSDNALPEDDESAQRSLTRISPSELLFDIRPLLHAFVPDDSALHWDVTPNLPPVQGNRAQLKRVVINLVKNAIEALRGSTGSVTVRARLVDIDARQTQQPTDVLRSIGRHICVEVSDQGCGMDKATLRKVFDSSWSSKSGGHGLGLASVRDIVARHRGRMELQSEPQRGTTVRILLPCACQSAQSQNETSCTEDGSSGCHGEILVVDDQRALRWLAHRVLESGGFRVTSTESAEEALSILNLSHRRFRAVLLDMKLEGICGSEAFYQIRLIDPHLPVVIMTGCSQSEIDEEFHGIQQPDAYLQKPFDSETLLSLMHSMGQLSDRLTAGPQRRFEPTSVEGTARAK